MISRILYGTSSGGANSGRIGYILENNNALTKEEVGEISWKIFRDRGKSKSIEIRENNPAYDINMHTLIKALSGNGYIIQAIIDGTISYPWLDPFPVYTVVELKENWEWPAFKVNEVRFHLDNIDTQDPVLPETPPLLYLIPSKLKPLEVLEWIEGSNYSWAINVEPKKLYRRTVWETS